MTKIVIADKRYSNWSRGNKRQSWITIAEYQGKNIDPVFNISPEILYHWRTNKNELGYATFSKKGCFIKNIKEMALAILSLAKGNKVNLAINRWGDVVGYKIKTGG